MSRVTDVQETVNQAIQYVKSDPCCICSYGDGVTGKCHAGVKYKGVCPVRMQLKARLFIVKEMEDKP